MEKGAQQTRKRGEDYFIWGILIVLILFHTAVNYIVLRQDNVFFEMDSSGLYLPTVRFVAAFPKEDLAGKLALFSTNANNKYPPFVVSVGAAFLAIFGIGQDAAVMANAPFIATLIVSVFFIGKNLMNREAGLLAAIIVSFFPGIFSMSRAHSVYLPLAAMTALSVLLLLRTESMSKRKESAVLGAVLGLTSLTCPQFSLHLAGPLMVIVIPPFFKAIRSRKSSEILPLIVNPLIAGIIFVIIAAPWYAFHTVINIEEQGGWLPHSLFNPSQYRLRASVSDITTFGRLVGWLTFKPVWYVFCGAFAYVVLVYRKHRMLLTTWLLGLHIGFIFLGLNNDESHLLTNLVPALPAAALIIALCVTDISKLLLRSLQRGRRELPPFIPLVFLMIEMPLFLFLTFYGSGDITAPFGELKGRGRNFMSNMHGRISPYNHAFDLEGVAEELADELTKRGGVPLLFLFNPSGSVTDGLVRTELGQRKARNLIHYDTTECVGDKMALGYADSIIDTGRAALLENSSCQERFDSSDYAIIETLKYFEPMRYGEENYSDLLEIQSEDFIQFSQQLKNEMAHYQIMHELTFEGSSPSGELQMWKPPHYTPPGFWWMNESIWIIKLR